MALHRMDLKFSFFDFFVDNFYVPSFLQIFKIWKISVPHIIIFNTDLNKDILREMLKHNIRVSSIKYYFKCKFERATWVKSKIKKKKSSV